MSLCRTPRGIVRRNPWRPYLFFPGCQRLFSGNFSHNAVFIVFLAFGISNVDTGIEQWGEPDGKADFSVVSKLPVDYMAVYTATYSLPMAFNNRPEIYQDNFRRISYCRDGGKIRFFQITSGVSQ